MVKIFTFFVALGATLAASNGATLAGSNGATLAGSNADSVSCLTVLKVKPEANPQGKPLSMEDANINYKVYPERAYVPKQPRPRMRYGVVDGSVYMLVYPDTTPGSPANPTAQKATGTTHTPAPDTVWIARAQGAVSYGVSVSRNEFGINGGLFPSPDSSKLAYYRKDESRVSIFPLLDISTRTGSLIELRYPMNGMPSERVDVCIWDSASRSSITLDADALAEPAVCDPQSKSCSPALFGDDRYLTNIAWQDGNTLMIQVVDRSQHYCKLALFDARSGELQGTILREENPEWVEPYEPTHPIDAQRFIYSTDNRDGFKNLYLCDLQGNIIRIPTAHADVQFMAHRGGWLYYTSAELSPAENHLFRIKLTLPRRSGSLKGVRFGRPQRLTSERGWHSIVMLSEGWYDAFSSFDNPGWTAVFSDEGKLQQTLVTSGDPLADYAACQVEFGTVPSADGLYQNHFRLIKPLGFDPSKKYPLVVYVYGGPHSQMVNDSWLGNIRMWEMLMAQRGYVVYCQDNRGTQNHGAAYEKAISRQCGQAEMQDQMVGIRALLAEPWIDSTRVGVHGWSYGGFMTISLATTYPDVFKVAVAGGPVIDWKWYEVMYGERYMDTPATNPEGFALTSLLDKAQKLECKLLICQGAIDDTVVWQHSLSFLQECIDAGRQVDYFPFPKAYHNMRGLERVYLYQKITDYFDNNL